MSMLPGMGKMLPKGSKMGDITDQIDDKKMARVGECIRSQYELLKQEALKN